MNRWNLAVGCMPLTKYPPMMNAGAAEIPAALTEAMTQLADGNLKLRDRTVRPLADAADVHAQLEAGTLRSKAILAV